ncbi:50S ribosomal protein L25 [Buchnera aphidicola (Formosaphis micheliae)]|uniref:50S ribosomal protein L25 n=1 Tax=Buchnera aphidicola TaxID=9 RepID=UPI0031B86002
MIYGTLRTDKGKSASRRFRIKNSFPAVVYGKEKSNLCILLDHDIMFNLQLKPDFYKKKCCLILEHKKHIVRLQSIQRHAFKPKLLHMDFIYV